MPTQRDKDVEDAIKKYERESKRTVEKGDVSIRGAAHNIVNRRNALDQLDEDMRNAGRSEYDKLVYGK